MGLWYVIRVTPAGRRAAAYLASGGTTHRDQRYATRMERGHALAAASCYRASHIGARVQVVPLREKVAARA